MAKLQDRDYVVVIDRSGSMTEPDTPTGQSRWDYAKESTIAIARKCNEFDPDGITVVTFAGKGSMNKFENTTPERVKDIFKEETPMGGTVLAPVLQSIFKDYLDQKRQGKAKSNGVLCLVVTDGQPSDEKEVAKTIVDFTRKLDNGDNEFGLSFMQIGRDGEATRFLKRLDDDLKGEGAKFDIVDTKTIDEVEQVGLVQTLLAALED